MYEDIDDNGGMWIYSHWRLWHEKRFAYVESNKNSMLVDYEKNALCDSYIVEFIHDATENYYEGGTYACRNCSNVKFPLYVLKILKLCLFAFLF